MDARNAEKGHPMKTYELIQRQAHTLTLNALDGVTHLSQPDRADLAEQITEQLNDELDLTRWSPRALNQVIGHEYVGMSMQQLLRHMQREDLLNYLLVEIDVHLSNLDIDQVA